MQKDLIIQFGSERWLIFLIAAVTGYFLLTLVVCRKQFTGKFNAPMDKGYTESMKGLMAILTALSHFAIHSDVSSYGKMIRGLGLPTVTVFLFISGYVEMTQLQKRNSGYFMGFPRRKLLRIYLPWVLSTVVLAVLFQIRDPLEILKGFALLKSIYRADTYNWFLMCILVNYSALYISGRILHCSSPGRYPAILYLVAAIWFAVTKSLNLGGNWYLNSFSFAIGATAAVNRERLQLWSERHMFPKLFLFALVSGILYLLPYMAHAAWKITLIRLTMTVFVCLLTWQLSITVPYQNGLFQNIGKLSLEIFFYATPLFYFYYAHFPANDAGLIVISVATIVFAQGTNMLASGITAFNKKNDFI